MAISTYAELTTAITTGWPHRSDLSGQSDNVIALAEAKFNRRLRSKHQETALSETAIDASYQVAIPSNVLAVKRMWRTDDPKTPLMPVTLDFIIEQQGSTSYGYSNLALHYCVEDAKFRFDGTGNVSGILYRSIPALSGSTTTNWLLTAHPDLYLYECMSQMNYYALNLPRAQMFEAKSDALIAELNRSEKRDEFSGPLMVRVR